MYGYIHSIIKYGISRTENHYAIMKFDKSKRDGLSVVHCTVVLPLAVQPQTTQLYIQPNNRWSFWRAAHKLPLERAGSMQTSYDRNSSARWKYLLWIQDT